MAESTGDKEKHRLFPTDVFELEMTLERTTKIPVNIVKRGGQTSLSGQSWRCRSWSQLYRVD